MNKTHKGATLVEVLVAMTVFLIICGAIFTSVIGIGKIVVKQEQTLRIGYLLSDVERFYDEDATDGKTEWLAKYCEYMGATLVSDGVGTLYMHLNGDFSYDDDGEYVLTITGTQLTLRKGEETLAARALGGQNDE